jgi:hypothetical protein
MTHGANGGTNTPDFLTKRPAELIWGGSKPFPIALPISAASASPVGSRGEPQAGSNEVEPIHQRTYNTKRLVEELFK